MCVCVFDMQETQVLEAEQARLKDQIESFQKEKTELEFILETHRAHCGPSTVGSRTMRNTSDAGSVPPAVTVSRPSSVNMTHADTLLSAMPVSHFPVSGNTAAEVVSSPSDSVGMSADIRQATAALPSASVLVSHAVGAGCRPTSLPSLSASRTSTTGINLLTVGLDSLADGHTGLTPLTGIPSGPVIVVGMPMVTSSTSTGDSSTVSFL